MSTDRFPQDIGFRYGTSESSLTSTAWYSSTINSSSGSYSVNLELPPSTSARYYYQAFMSVWNGSEYVEITSDVAWFDKPSSTSTSNTLNPDWLELPALPASLGDREAVTMRAAMNGKNTRNYSILYDPGYYASLWTAYNYCPAHHGSGSLSSWEENKSINGPQVSVTSSYNGYDRGHQVPNASRNGVSAMQKQTYYFTNSTPQLASFNQNIWVDLENAERSLVSSANDTIYVATGPVYQTVGGSESVSTVYHDGKNVPVPNYYYRVILKVKRNASGQVTAASAIGFWMPHTNDIADDDYFSSDYVKSVSFIEGKTGFTFFANLPSSVSSGAKSNTSWTTFQNFTFR